MDIQDLKNRISLSKAIPEDLKIRLMNLTVFSESLENYLLGILEEEKQLNKMIWSRMDYEIIKYIHYVEQHDRNLELKDLAYLEMLIDKNW